jgi:hypothetical protein
MVSKMCNQIVGLKGVKTKKEEEDDDVADVFKL